MLKSSKDPETVNYAVENAYLPARFQVISKKNKLSEFVHEEMMLILSASHNEGGAIELRKSLEDLKHKGPIYFVFAMNKSKDLKAFLSQFASLVTEVKAVHFREGFMLLKKLKNVVMNLELNVHLLQKIMQQRLQCNSLYKNQVRV